MAGNSGKFKNILYFLKKSYNPIKKVSKDNLSTIGLNYRALKSRIFDKPWTIFRFLTVWMGLTLGIIPTVFLLYVGALLIFLVIRFFAVPIDCFFKYYLLEHSKDKNKIKSRYATFKKITNWILNDFFIRYPQLVIEKFNYYFSLDYVVSRFFKHLQAWDDFFYKLIVDVEWWIIYRFSVTVSSYYRRSIKFYYRSRRVFNFLYFKLKKKRNRVILYYDLRKVIVIFKWEFFYMCWLDLKLYVRCLIIRKKAEIIYYFWLNYLKICFISFFLYFLFKCIIFYLIINGPLA